MFYLDRGVIAAFFYVFVAVTAVNLGIAGFSARGILRHYRQVFGVSAEEKILVMVTNGRISVTEGAPLKGGLEESDFPNAEWSVIEQLRAHDNRMLQSTLLRSVSISGASLSRAPKSLEDKSIVVMLRKGVTNQIILSETRFKRDG